jgi:YVTN family beta-propeller protein
MMALSPDESLLYAANWGSRSVSVIDTRARRELRRLPTGVHPRGLTVLRDGTLLAAAFHSDVIHVFPPGATEESTRYRMCRFPRHILHSPDSSTFYVTCSLGSVGFYRAGDGRRFGVGYTHRNPRTIDITHDGRFIGVANFSSNDVSLVDTRDHHHRNYALPGASRVVGLAMHPGPGIRMYATSWDTAELYMLTDAAADAAAPPSARSGAGE